ncbi:hypothetical protein KBA39_05895 [Myxococcota bacterium]|nr:hypothetical protein [Myxococcota bacterium]
MTIRMLLVFTVALLAGSGLGCSTDNSPSDVSGGPFTQFAVHEDYPWCEDLEAQGIAIDANPDTCQFKYLDRGYVYWTGLASVGFVGQVEPDCDDGEEMYCLPSEFGQDCLSFCPFKLTGVSRVLFGDPQSIETLATFSHEPVEIDGEQIDAVRVDGGYPSPLWRIVSGENLIFAHRNCNAQRYVGYDDLYMVVGIYPIKDGVVRDADDRSILLDDLWEAFHTMDLNVNEAADYASRCDYSR